jgi:hypothetical protein
MKSPSLDAIYAQLDKHILLAQAYSEIGGLVFLIKSCRLKPYNYIQDKNAKLILHTLWVDEYNNSLTITKYKKLKIIYNDLRLSYNICTDLYYGLSIEKVAKISKLAFIFAGKDEDMLQDYFMIAFLGIDNYLRAYTYMYGEWRQVSPLLLGLKNLKTIGKNAGIDNYLELKIKDNIPSPCISPQAWITYLPASSEFLQILDKQHDVVSSIFNTKE